MAYDHAQSPRLGQRGSIETTSVRMFAGTEIPEAAWRGQIIYRTDTQGLQVFNGKAWEDVVSGYFGQLTYVGPVMPETGVENDLWYDSDDGYKLYIHNGSIWEEQLLNGPQINRGRFIGGSVEIGGGYWNAAEGIVVPQPDGQTTRLSADPDVPSTWAGKVITAALTMIDGMLTGLLEVLGTIRLKKGVTAPRVAPDVTVHYPQTVLPSSEDRYGLCDSSDLLYWVTLNRATNRIETFEKSTGLAGVTFSVTGDCLDITRIGSTYYVLRKPSNSVEYYVTKYSMVGVAGTTFTVASQNSANVPVVGNDGTNVIVGFGAGGGEYRVRRYDTNGVFVDAEVYNLGVNGVLGEVLRGSFDWGVNRVILVLRSDEDARVFNTGGPADTARNFKIAYDNRVFGMWWDGTRFNQLNGTGQIYHYGTNLNQETKTVGYAWLSTDGTRRTQISPIYTHVRPRRSQLLVSTPPPPEASATGNDNASRAAIYVGSSTTNLKLQADLAQGTTNLALNTFLTATNPVTANGFANIASVGGIESESGLTYIKGNDDAKVWGADTWHTIAGLAWDTDTQAVQYRIDASGVVQLRGRVDATGETTGWVAFTLPAGYRPQFDQYGFATISGPTSNWQVARVDIRATGDVELYWSGGETRISLNGVRFSVVA
jgi:hypothetical protein